MPSPEHTNPFSFNTYPGLDAAVEQAYVSHSSPEPKPPQASGLARAVQDALDENPETTLLSEEARQWISGYFEHLEDSWAIYSTLGTPFPQTFRTLEARNPNFAATIERLYRAQADIFASNEMTQFADGTSQLTSETMKPVAIPWAAFRDNLPYFGSFMAGLRSWQRIRFQDEGDTIMSMLKNNQPLYYSQSKGRLLTPIDYLEEKIEQDGLWGIGLIQTSPSPGCISMRNKNIAELTHNGRDPLTLAGHDVGALGVFEWMATTLQEDPALLSTGWDSKPGLRANYVPGKILYSSRDNYHISTWFGSPEDDDVVPRLAVL